MKALANSVALMVLGLASSALLAQSSMPPASIYTGGMKMATPRASITSTPSAPQFRMRLDSPRRDRDHDGNNFPQRGYNYGYTPYYYGYTGYPVYPSPVYVEDTTLPNAGTFNTTQPAPVEPESKPAAPTVIVVQVPATSSQDAHYGTHSFDNQPAPGSQPTEHAAPISATPSDEPETILIFHDGHKIEVQNYAIVNGHILVLSGKYAKIALADLNLPATIKANDDNGVDFHVPGSSW